jgi:hypothetical protein
MTTSTSIDRVIRDALGDAGVNLGAPDAAKLQAFAARAGAVHGAGLQHIVNEFAQAKGDRGQVLKKGLGDLQTQGAVTSGEAAQLQLVFDAVNKASNPSDAAAQVQKVYDKLKGDPKTGAAALMIVGIGLDSLQYVARKAGQGGAPVPRLNWRRTAGADMVGAVSGWLLGLALTNANPAGGAVGGAVGAIAVSAVDIWDQLIS